MIMCSFIISIMVLLLMVISMFLLVRQNKKTDLAALEVMFINKHIRMRRLNRGSALK